MVDSRPGASTLDGNAGAAGPHLTDAFELLSDGTRLAILLALWDAYDPANPNESVSFSTLQDRVGVRDSGNFTYHLDRLLGHFVEERDGGYCLRNAGRKIVQATIAGTGLQDRTLPLTEVDMSCYLCGGQVEITYEDEQLFHVCADCEGHTGPGYPQERPAGTLMVFDFDPAGLANRAAGEVFLAGTIKALANFESLISGICPECSGPIEDDVEICEAHEAPEGGACPTCGTRDEVRVSYVCTVCKHGDSYPVHAAVYDHPAVVGFCHEQGIETTYSLDGPGSCGSLWTHLLQREYTLVSRDPTRIRVHVPGDDAKLDLTLDGDLAVVDVTETDLEQQGGDGDRESRLTGRSRSGSTNRGGAGADGGPVLDRANCLAMVRCHRWPNGVRCPHCGSEDTIKKGRTGKDLQRYRCHHCERIFNDLTGTVFANHRLSVSEMFQVLLAPADTDVSRIAAQIERSVGSVRSFIDEVRAVSERDEVTIFSVRSTTAEPT